MAERQYPKLHVVSSIPIELPRSPVGPVMAYSKVFKFLAWLTEEKLGGALGAVC